MTEQEMKLRLDELPQEKKDKILEKDRNFIFVVESNNVKEELRDGKVVSVATKIDFAIYNEQGTLKIYDNNNSEGNFVYLNAGTDETGKKRMGLIFYLRDHKAKPPYFYRGICLEAPRGHGYKNS